MYLDYIQHDTEKIIAPIHRGGNELDFSDTAEWDELHQDGLHPFLFTMPSVMSC
ncbi:hypothetical protein ACEQPO_14620 [Bacillus sp. SL00103]